MSRSIFDIGNLGEIETATNVSDILEEEVKSINLDDYEGNNYYFFCANIHPSFALFVPIFPKSVVNNQMKKLIDKRNSSDDEVREKAFIEALQTIFGVNNMFQKYSKKGGARELEKYAQQGHQEYKNFCNDVVLYNIYMKVFFNRPFEIWDPKKVEELGLL